HRSTRCSSRFESPRSASTVSAAHPGARVLLLMCGYPDAAMVKQPVHDEHRDEHRRVLVASERVAIAAKASEARPHLKKEAPYVRFMWLWRAERTARRLREHHADSDRGRGEGRRHHSGAGCSKHDAVDQRMI